MIDSVGLRSVAVAAGFLALWASPGRADAPTQVIVSTGVVLASNSGPARGIDRELRTLEVSLRRFPYASYRLLQTENRPVEMNGWAEFPLPGARGRYLLVRPTDFKEGRISLSVMLMQGRMTLMNTVLRLRNQGEFVVAGPQHGDGVLFLSIGAAVPPSGR